MAWFRKKTDPISDRARALNEEIAELEQKIKKLDSRLQSEPSQPKLRSTALPHGATLNHATEVQEPQEPPPATHEPIFEDVNLKHLKTHADLGDTPEHFNELGIRKYDLPALLQRIRHHFKGPSTTNPKLVSYLAAGGIQGLRPMRYEKRVARNRFIALVIVLFATLLGILAVFLRHR
jgi:hypothetical protein